MDVQVVARKLGIGARVCVASPAYVAARGSPKSPDELVDHDCLVVGPSRLITWPFEHDARTHAIAVTARYAVSSVELVHRAALAGHGITVLPTFLCAGDLATGRLVAVLDGWSPGEVAVHLVYPSHRHLPLRVRAFVDLVVERMPSFPHASPQRPASTALSTSR
jgi:DNA-binding transcriptional LysR family regulator